MSSEFFETRSLWQRVVVRIFQPSGEIKLIAKGWQLIALLRDISDEKAYEGSVDVAV